MDSDSEEFDLFDPEDLKPRSYQFELLQKAIDKNIIAFLDTGTGKTLIALMLMKEMQGKSVFLAPKRILVKQQSQAASNFGISNLALVGESADQMDYFDWQSSLSKVQALFLTPELFLNTLRSGYLSLNQFKLLIFDECHHCNKKDPYMKIMIEFYHAENAYKPKILGLTASPVSSGSSNQFDLKRDLQTLCNFLDSSFVQINRDTVNLIANDPKFVIEAVEDSKEDYMNCISYYLARFTLNDYEGESSIEILMKNGMDLVKFIGKKSIYFLLKDIAKRVEDEEARSVLENLPVNDDFSNRFLYLIEVLKKHFDSNGGQVIILVKKRIVTWYLSECLNYYSKANNLEIKSEKLLGKMSRKIELGLFKVTDQRQKEIVQDFKSGKFTVLVSTSVAEEGLDIPSCDLVIRYDHISDNLASYVQSKGRAREKTSKFLILTEKENKKKVEEKIKRFNETLKYLKEIADRDINPKGPIKFLGFFQVPSDHLTSLANENFTPSGAKVSENWSIEFIESFCRELDRKKYCRHQPVYTCKHVRSGSTDISLEGPTDGYICSLKFPKLLDLPEVQSKKIHSKEAKAKQEAALQGVKLLYEKGYLNKFLKPFWLAKIEKQGIQNKDPEIELVDEKGFKVRPKRKTDDNKHTTLLPQDLSMYSLKGRPDTEFFIYVVESSPEYPYGKTNLMGIMAPILTESVSFNLFPFNIFRYTGIDLHTEKKHANCKNCKRFPFKINLRVLYSGKFEQEVLRNLKLFHMIVNSICRGSYNELIQQYSSNPSLFSVNEVPVLFLPIAGERINFTLIDEIVTFFKNDANGSLDYKLLNLTPGSLIKSSHLKEFYIYLRTIPKGIDYEFEDKHKITSVREYFLQKYNMKFSTSTVLELKSVGCFKQALRPRIVSSHFQESIYIPIELCEFFPLPCELMIWCKLSPNIFHKLNQSFLVSTMKSFLNIEISNKILIEAVTCGSSQEGTDYQRLEILGDSVLKFITSEFLYKSNPRDLEGMLTQKRMVLTSNDTLFKKALDLKLYRYMQSKVFTSKLWAPLGLEKVLSVQESESSEEEVPDYIDEYGFEKLLDEEGQVKIETRKDVVELSFKQLADCVEALIGASYVQGGIPLAEKFIKHSLSLFPDSSYSIRKIREVNTVKIQIGYEFKNEELLVEALTHPTAQKAFDYNRLEFLGDAVIDFITLEYFYNKFPAIGPGSLSKMKATAVSNRTFSYISYKIGLADYLIFSGQELRSDLKKFKEHAEKLLNPSHIVKLQDSGMKVMADLFESLTGAIYLDSESLETTREFVLRHLQPILDTLNPANCNLHPHNRIFDFAQRHKKSLGGFRIERFKVAQGGDYEFLTKIYIQEKVVAEGRGTSKLESSEAAADIFFKRFSDKS